MVIQTSINAATFLRMHRFGNWFSSSLRLSLELRYVCLRKSFFQIIGNSKLRRARTSPTLEAEKAKAKVGCLHRFQASLLFERAAH